VLEARHGEDALRVAERHLDAIHLLLTDVVDATRERRELADRLARCGDDEGALHVGYTEQSRMRIELPRAPSFCRNRLPPEILARRVRLILDSTEQVEG